MNQKNKVVYLAGPINGCTDAECKDWREFAKSNLNSPTLDPMRRDYRGQEAMSYKEIVEHDLLDIDNCSVMLVNAPKPSWGTAMEVFYAKYVRQLYVVMIIPKDSVLSPWQQYFSDKVVYSVLDGIQYINAL